MTPDLKKVAVDLFKNGENISDIARILQQPRSTISDIIKRFREAGTSEIRKTPRHGRHGLPAVGENCEN
jgi:transposase